MPLISIKLCGSCAEPPSHRNLLASARMRFNLTERVEFSTRNVANVTPFGFDARQDNGAVRS